MFSKILNKLVIIGLNPETNGYSVVLDNDNAIPNTEKDVDSLLKTYVDTPVNWCVIRKQTFVGFEDVLYLVYNVVIPKNMKLKTGKWLDLADTSSVSIADKHIILEGTNI